MEREGRKRYCYVCSPELCSHAHAMPKPTTGKFHLTHEEAGRVIIPNPIRYRTIEELRTEKPFVPTSKLVKSRSLNR